MFCRSAVTCRQDDGMTTARGLLLYNRAMASNNNTRVLKVFPCSSVNHFCSSSDPRRSEAQAGTGDISAYVGGDNGEGGIPAGKVNVGKAGDHGGSGEWKIVARPVIETILRRYGQQVTANRVMIVHGPRGVGKRTIAERVLVNWEKGNEHAIAYIDLLAAPSTGYGGRLSRNRRLSSGMSPWMLCSDESERPTHVPAGADADDSMSEGECPRHQLLTTTEVAPTTVSTLTSHDPSKKVGMPRQFGSSTLPLNDSIAAWAGDVEEEEGDAPAIRGQQEVIIGGQGRGALLCADLDAADDLHGVEFFKAVLESKLEELARRAVDLRLIAAETVLCALLELHSVDGALQRILRSVQPQNNGCNAERSGFSGADSASRTHTEGGNHSATSSITRSATEDLWDEALWLLHKSRHHHHNDRREQEWSLLSGSNGSVATARGRNHPPCGHIPVNADALGANKYVPALGKNKNRSSEDPELAWTAVALAKQVLCIQQEWRLRSKLSGGGFEQKTSWDLSSGPVADALTSWSTLLINLLSGAAAQGKFQPKLMINGIDELRRAKESSSCACSGAAFHDMLVMRVLDQAVKKGCMPIILLSSDSYYSADAARDFGSVDFFESLEVFAWTPAEAAVHFCGPHLFSETQWRTIVDALGAHPRHLSELYSMWQQSHLRNAELGIEHCLEEYLFFLQVVVVDKAMDKALDLLQSFAKDAATRPKPMLAGVAWKRLPDTNDSEVRRAWARLQMMDFITSLAGAEFGVSYRDDDAVEFLQDPAARALLQSARSSRAVAGVNQALIGVGKG
ncbi:hypothetical protein CBR_g25881 [Chara braunii]|uniref:Uncharacterized protein n=1 Tax=Chara braunii TaxID=69332 RepID=A0A388L6L7_CHABU|nr:hypothetical protein CBR_g25881 [Chara braunii]|eukprot:GBG77950.1 hypothetical protein CBR_g25881 [Chara braunii]